MQSSFGDKNHNRKLIGIKNDLRESSLLIYGNDSHGFELVFT